MVECLYEQTRRSPEPKEGYAVRTGRKDRVEIKRPDELRGTGWEAIHDSLERVKVMNGE